MGVLGMTGKMNEGSLGEAAPAPEDAPADTQDQSSEPEAKAEFVPYSEVEKKAAGRSPTSRRARAEAELEAKLNDRFKALEDRFGTERQTYEQRMASLAEQNARLQGQIETMQRMPPPAAPAAPAGPDLQDLRRQAKQALDEGRFDDYDRLREEVTEAVTEQKVSARVKKEVEQIQARIPPQVDPAVNFLMTQHRNVAMSGQRGIEFVINKEKELHLSGMAPGPERLAEAFKQADQLIAALNGRQPAQPQRPRYSPDAAAALAAVPGRRAAPGGTSGGDEGETLTPLQMKAAKDAGMSKEEYIRWMPKNIDRFGPRR